MHLGVQLAHGRTSFAAKLRDETRVLHGSALVKGGSDGDAILVDDYNTDHALVPLQPLQRLLHLARLACHSGVRARQPLQ